MENIELLRSQLVEKIFSTNNIGVLQAIDDLLASIRTKEEEEFVFSESQKDLLLLAEEDIKYGRTTTDEELRKLDEEWMR
ncbi:hypothetical protein J3D55_003360 [Chryseobacterium ginsenosidimutans]|uniref:hypothetical protein n=1 Tax=Chryseobacterium ginsenosidimutans TaxID=687846 RepID=UPI00216966E0|nr:hypothetical protein [Chryseobacterium ginsenosidimutans]MCS3870444.1 hypothetical protein [Chryseobacterium ginsenosidimutans]